MTKFISRVINRICLLLYNADVSIIIIIIFIIIITAGKSVYFDLLLHNYFLRASTKNNVSDLHV